MSDFLGNYVLFCPIHKTSLNVMLPIARQIKRETKVDVKFLFGRGEVYEEIDEVVKEEFQSIILEPYDHKIKNKFIQKIHKKFLQILDIYIILGYPVSNSIFKWFNEFYQHVDKYYNELVRIFSDSLPISVVIPDDRSVASGLLPALLKICNELKINTVIPPISYAGDMRSLKASEYRKKYCRVKHKKLFEKYSGNLVRVDKNYISFYPTIITEILYRINALPKNPWVLGGGLSSKVLAEGEAARLRLVENGCDPAKIIVVGHSSHDALFLKKEKKSSIRTCLKNKYKLSKDNLIILSLPQLGEHNILGWNEHWKEIHFLCDIFSKSQADTLISLHPKMDIKEYSFITEKYNIPILGEALQDVLPAADIFAATFSSTVEWAVLCNIPTIVFDFYSLGYNMYDNYNGVVIINNRSKLLSTINRIQNDGNYYEFLRLGHMERAKYLSPFDGKCTQRIIYEITNI